MHGGEQLLAAAGRIETNAHEQQSSLRQLMSALERLRRVL